MKFNLNLGRRAAEENDTTNDRFENDGFFRGDEDENEGIVEDGMYSGTKAAESVAPAKRTSGGAGGNTLKVVKPRGAADGGDIAEYLMEGYTVVVNIEELDRNTTVRLVDFLQGALYVLGGELRRVTKTTLVLSPRCGEVSTEEYEEDGN